MKLMELYDAMLWEVGEGSSELFPYEVDLDGAYQSQYVIDGEANGEQVIIRLHLFYTDLNAEQVKEIKDGFFDKGDPLGAFVVKAYDEIKDGVSVADVMFEWDNAPRVDMTFTDINDPKYMFRLMATIKKIIAEKIAEKGINVIGFSSASTKGDGGARRDRLYDLFIKKAVPTAREVNIGLLTKKYFLLK